MESKDDISEDEEKKKIERGEDSDKGEERSDKDFLINYRCYITSYHLLILKVKKKMSQHHLSRMGMTPFHTLLDVPSIKQGRAVIDDLLAAYETNSSCFKIGNHLLRQSAGDVGLILASDQYLSHVQSIHMPLVKSLLCY